MGEHSAISWTDHTFNPWMGCSKVSPACDNCYAEALGKRTGRVQWGDDAERVPTSDGYWSNPIKWNRAAEEARTPAFVFCASMADVFEARGELDELRARLFALVESTPWLVWLLLTKRPENIRSTVPVDWLSTTVPLWPRNVWVGTTVEDQERADERIPHLLGVPAPRRFLSCEPLLGPIDLRYWLFDLGEPDWVIVGGESGPGHRVMDLDAFTTIVEKCSKAGVPVWSKQDSGAHSGRQGRIPDELWIHQRPEAMVPA